MKGATFTPVFRKFIISYLIVLLLPNISGYFTYRAAIDAALSSSIENSRILLNQSKEILETRLKEVETFTKQLAINQDLTKLVSEKMTGDTYNVYGLWKMSRDISNYNRTNDFLQNFYIYLKNYNVVITPESVFFRPEHFYVGNHYEDLSFTQWEESILKSTHEFVSFPLQAYTRGNVQTSVITFVQSLPLNSFNNPKATVVVTIDEQKIRHLLESMSSHNGGWAFITNPNGSTMVSQGIEQSEIKKLFHVPSGQAGDQERIENGMLLISIKSGTTGWLYTAGIPEKSIKEKADQIKYATWIFTAVTLIVGLLIIVLLAYRNSAPITQLISVFKELSGLEPLSSKNEYVFLAGNISKLITNNKQLEAELDKQLPLLRDAFIKRLLAGEFLSLQEIEAVSLQTGIKLNAENGYVGLIKINGYSRMDSEEIIHELSLARLAIKPLLSETELKLLLTDWGSDKIAFLYLLGEGEVIGENSRFEQQLLQLTESAYSQYRMTISIAIGGSYQTLRDISKSFDEAQQAMDAVYTGEKRISWYKETVSESAMYYYPIDTQQRLLNTLKAGEIDEGLRILDQVFSRNFSGRELSYEMKQQFISELKGTLLKLLDQKPFQDEKFSETVKHQIAQVQPMDDVDQLRVSFVLIMKEICNVIAKKKNDYNNETIYAIKLHVENEYTNSDLSIYQIVESVKRPEKFISHLFKEQTGENLSDYLERVRIDKATVLLMENQRTIDEIAVMVGYNSGHSFRRAFKRVKGVSPTVFRQTSD
ncbi:AraC family transcriptional regulator [Paenibacillus psychroresistens]|uniref:AraC family transcriptional regulator n=1 Tax=Paenibacillus psychroresistens TaxID=1778678 RepID=A0A6B8REE6_9BACL|nr:helix-turn-helix domain-containing protein [Paenibacillus psychroresistens]QGQ94851.1 AraC family transcriptional regulator [Paenibacillus psychroresistens]